MSRLLSLLLLTITLISCSKGDEPGGGYNPPTEASQTLLVYLPGRQLGNYYLKNIEDIKAAVNASIPGSGRILVCHQPEMNTKANLIEIYYNTNTKQAETTVLKQYTQFNAASTYSVEQLLTDAATIAPARRYGLQIGCHGKAWVPSKISMLSRQLGGNYTAEQAFWTPLEGALQTRSFGDTNFELDITELAKAIKASKLNPEFIIFDACFMANIETLYDLREVTNYVVAAPAEIMAAGFPFSRTTPHLFTADGNYDLKKLCYDFWYFYEYDWNTVPHNAKSGCISLCVMDELNQLSTVMQRVVASGLKTPTEEIQSYEGMATHLFYDLGHYVSLACDDAALRTEFSAQLRRAFPVESSLNTKEFYSAYNGKLNPIKDGCYSGVSVSEPATRLVNENKQTSWYRATHN